MSYLVAQLRKDSTTQYMSPLIGEMTESDILKKVKIPSPFDSEAESQQNQGFEDLIIRLPNNLSVSETYYLRFTIKKVLQNYYSTPNKVAILNGGDADSDTLNFIVYLGRTGENFQDGDPIYYDTSNAVVTYNDLSKLQQIGTAYVPCQVKESIQQETDIDPENIITCPNCGFQFTKEGSESHEVIADPEPEYITFSYVFKPMKSDYNTILLKLNRIGYDVLVEPRNWLLQTTTVTDESMNESITFYSNIKCLSPDGQISKLNNIIPQNRTPWKKMGYQSRPGSLIVINDEPIRVGRSGIYELNNGMDIVSFMIANPNGSNIKNIDAFLLDYVYEG